MIPLFKVFTAKCAAERVARVLASGYTAQGPIVEEFEKLLRDYLHEPHLLTVSSGTAALELACLLANVSGGEVVSTPQTCSATNGAIVRAGAKIVWADTDPFTGNIDPTSVNDAMSSLTSGIMAVDWSGRYCNYAAMPPGIPVIRDAAHAFGAAPRACRSDYMCWSFQSIKHLSTGDGGALAVPEAQFERARKLRWFGLDRAKGESFRCAQDIEEVGFKMHMNDIAAAIGIENFKAGFAPDALVAHEINILQQHQENAKHLLDGLQRIENAVSYDFAFAPPYDPTSAYWILTLLVDLEHGGCAKNPKPSELVRIRAERDNLSAFLATRGVASSRVHRRNDEHTAFQRASEWRVPHPGLDYFDAAQLSIPCGWWVGEHERNTILMALFDYANHAKS